MAILLRKRDMVELSNTINEMLSCIRHAHTYSKDSSETEMLADLIENLTKSENILDLMTEDFEFVTKKLDVSSYNR